MLALVVGRGALPAAVVAAQKTTPLICALDGHQPDGLDVDMSFRIERLGGFIHTLCKRGVTEVCFCGAIQRPKIDPKALDLRTLPLLPALSRAVGGGEDSALRTILGFFEAKGLKVRGAHELAPDLLPPQGVLTRASPTPETEALVKLADGVRDEQAATDLGQSCIMRDGAVLAREDARGTDAMLRDLVEPYERPELGGGDPIDFAIDLVGDALGAAADWLSGPVAEARAKAKGGVMLKAPKRGQDRRVDLPTIGPDTAMLAAEAGLDGIVIDAGGVIVLDQPRVIAILDGMGMFLWVR